MSVDGTKVSGATCAINERPGSAIYSKLLEFWTSLVSDAWSRQAAGSPLGTRITWKFHGGGAACYRFRRMRGWGSASLQNHSSMALAKIIQVRLRNCPLAGSLHRRQNSCPAQNSETRTSKLWTFDARATGDNVWILMQRIALFLLLALKITIPFPKKLIDKICRSNKERFRRIFK